MWRGQEPGCLGRVPLFIFRKHQEEAWAPSYPCSYSGKCLLPKHEGLSPDPWDFHRNHSSTCSHATRLYVHTVHTQSAHTVYKQSSGNRNSEISLYVSFVPCVLQLLTDQLGILNEGKRGGIVHGQRACQEWSVCLTVRLVFSLCASLWSCGHPMPF